MPNLFKKLNLAEDDTMLVLNAPDSFEGELAKLSGVKIHRRATSKPVPFGIGFATTQAELNQVSEKLANSSSGDATVWIAYPKKSSKRFKCEFNRDSGDWTVLGKAGFEAVRQVAIDEDWSALRFRKTEHIQSLTRKSSRAISAEGKRRTKR